MELSRSVNPKNKYAITKTIFIILLLSADIGKTTGIPNLSFYLVLIMSMALILFYSLSKQNIRLKYLKSELVIYVCILILATFIPIYTLEMKSIIHVIKLLLIFYIVYPTIKTFFTVNQIVDSLKINLIINFILMKLGSIGIEFASRLTGYLRGSTLLNYAGSLYKVALILLPYILWDLINNKKNKPINMIFLATILYVIFFDGSRTGILSVLILFVLYAMLILLRFLKRLKCSYSSLFSNAILTLTAVMIIVINREPIMHSNAYIRGLQTVELLLKLDMREFLLTADSARGYMILDAIETIKNNYFILGNGFQSTKTDGVVVHNGYLQVFADLGLFPALSLLILTFHPIIKGMKNIKNNNDLVPSVMLLIIFSFSLLLHPFSVQVSDWALYIIPISIITITLSDS